MNSIQMSPNFFICVAVTRPSSCQQLDCIEHYQLTYLLSVEQNVSDELRITATPESRERYTNTLVDSCNVVSLPEPTSWLIPNVSLSPECGPEYFRCRELLVETSEDGSESTVVFVPLKNGMLLLNIMLYETNNLTLEWQSFFADSSDCSPTVVFKTENKVFTVCINSVNNYIAVYELQVHRNGSLIYDVEFSVEPLTRVSIVNLSSSFVSNFVLKLSSQEHKVFFAIDNFIYVMDVSNPSQTKQYSEVPGCDRVHRVSLLVTSAGEQSLLAYCSDIYVCYDLINDNDWTYIHGYSIYGTPYLCPNGNYEVTFRIFNDTWRSLQFSVTNTKPMSLIIDELNVNVTSGVCFEVGNTTYFVWSDQQQNTISVFDFATQTHYPVASYECLSIDSPQLLLLANQYIVYDVDYTTYVLNAETNFSLIFNVSRSDSARVNDTLKTVLNISVPYYYYKNNGSTTSTDTVRTTNSPVNISTTVTTTAIPDITDSNLPTTSTVFPTTVNHNNIIIPTVTVIAGTVIIGILVSITIAISVIFLRKRQTR